MAERKIGDLWISMVVGVFFLTIFTTLFLSLDEMHGLSNSLGADLSRIDNNTRGDYEDIERTLESSTYNTSTFTIKENQFIDTRGTGQDFIISKDTVSSNQGFLTNMGSLIGQPIIMTMLVSLLISVGVILFFRFWKPGGI